MNSNHDYSLDTDYMWYKMILESFQNQTSKDDCLGYFRHQYQIRRDDFVEQSYFFKTCKEHTISLKKAFTAILENNYKPPTLNPIAEQVYKCEFVFGYDKSIEYWIFEEKSLLIEVKDFDNIISALESAIVNMHDSFTKAKNINSKQISIGSFKLKDYNRKQSSLTDLRKSLVDKGFIAKETSLAGFKKIFKGEKITKPVLWTGNPTELGYFIKQLHNELELVENLKQSQWFIAVKCFVDKDGNPFKRETLKGSKTPASKDKIDSALRTLK